VAGWLQSHSALADLERLQRTCKEMEEHIQQLTPRERAKVNMCNPRLLPTICHDLSKLQNNIRFYQGYMYTATRLEKQGLVGQLRDSLCDIAAEARQLQRDLVTSTAKILSPEMIAATAPTVVTMGPYASSDARRTVWPACKRCACRTTRSTVSWDPGGGTVLCSIVDCGT